MCEFTRRGGARDLHLPKSARIAHLPLFMQFTSERATDGQSRISLREITHAHQILLCKITFFRGAKGDRLKRNLVLQAV